jgi:thiosulfate dehydrogenase [quinone] large subunit
MRYPDVATLLLRFWLGLLMLGAGVGKVGNPASFRDTIHQMFDKTFLAGPLLSLFAWAQPWAEVILGALVLIGLWTRGALALTAANLIVLFFGMLVAQNHQTVAFNSLYVLMAVYALRSSARNRYSIDHLLGCRRKP